MIREAVMRDLDVVVELGRKSTLNGSYSYDMQFNREQAVKFATQVISQIGRVLLWEEDGKVTGLYAFILSPHYFTGDIMATEVMWYVEPEARVGAPGMKLLWAAEELAKRLGAARIFFTMPADKEQMGDLLCKRSGYKKIEVNYQKVL